MDIRRSGSQPSGKGPADYFTGTVRIDPLFQANLPKPTPRPARPRRWPRRPSRDAIRPNPTCRSRSSRDGNLTLVGAPAKPLGDSAFGLIMGRRSLSGSNIGGIAETQQMLDFCGAHNITVDAQIIPSQKVNEGCQRLLKADVKYRFSIDIGFSEIRVTRAVQGKRGRTNDAMGRT